ncbi:hypothetical protein V7S43_012822 [Phytophthora oleae]|uniref:Ankyrin repeat protein n=1 Tax=Phytophthora oleae TaxID=2107226 RepID=A0ABD3F7R0_9STRA
MEGFTPAAIDMAVRRGNLEVLQWLFSHRPEHCIASAMDEAAVYGHFDVVWFLHQNVREYDSFNTLKNALMPLSRLGFAEWAYIHHRHEFELNIAEQLFADLRI